MPMGKLKQEADEQRVERAGDGARQPCAFREAAVGVEEQLPVERRAHQALGLQRVEGFDLRWLKRGLSTLALALGKHGDG